MRNYLHFALFLSLFFTFGCLKKDMSIAPAPYLAAEVSNKQWVADSIETSFAGGEFKIMAKTKKGQKTNFLIDSPLCLWFTSKTDYFI